MLAKVQIHLESLKNGRQRRRSVIERLEQEQSSVEKEVKEAEMLLVAEKAKLLICRTEIFKSVVEGRSVPAVRYPDLGEAPPGYEYNR